MIDDISRRCGIERKMFANASVCLLSFSRWSRWKKIQRFFTKPGDEITLVENAKICSTGIEWAACVGKHLCTSNDLREYHGLPMGGIFMNFTAGVHWRRGLEIVLLICARIGFWTFDGAELMTIAIHPFLLAWNILWSSASLSFYNRCIDRGAKNNLFPRADQKRRKFSFVILFSHFSNIYFIVSI